MKLKTIYPLILALCGCFWAFAWQSCAEKRGANQQSSQSQNNELQTLLANGAFVVDVRSPEEFAEGHAAGSINIPIDVLPQNIDKFKGHEHIVVVCKSGGRAEQAKEFLAKQGITQVTNAGAWENVKSVLP